MSDRTEYVFQVRTVHRICGVATSALYVLVLIVMIGGAWLGRAGLVRGLHSPDLGTRVQALATLLLVAMVLASALLHVLHILRYREPSPRGVAAMLDGEKIVLTDEKGQTVEFRWYSLEDVLVFPRNRRGTGMVFLLAGDRSAFVPQSVRDPEELLAEMVRRGGLVLIEEAPGYRRYGRRATPPT